jgi:ATP-dependent DNA helicase RecQ
MQDQILYIDLETTLNGKLKDIGALYNGQEFHGNDLKKVEEFITCSKYVCGHNIINHDLPILRERLGEQIFDGCIVIDTLYWSPLIFANKPYHKLVKGYKIVNEKDYSNPLSDCKLTRQLLYDELEGFCQLDDRMIEIYYHLLKDDPRYNGFFELNKAKHSSEFHIDLIFSKFHNQICSTFEFSNVLQNNPVALAYALAIINTKDEDSVCSSWVINQEPMAQLLLEELRFTDCKNPECNYCAEKLDPKKSLYQFFGYTDFRSFDYDDKISLQEKTVRAGLQNQSFVAVFPTGGGKSLTFQLPALMKGTLTRQLTIVISPLVSLMKDQVDVLQSRFGIVKAVTINSLLSPLERKEAIDQVKDGGAHILYIAPESLRSPSIIRLLKDRAIARFVIDEAHCFSTWGQDFRVDYLYIGEFIRQLTTEKSDNYHIPISCFTATAKPQVIEDIKTYFKERLDLNLREYVTRSQRENLHYEVINVEDTKQKSIHLISLLSTCEKPAIVYSSRTRRVEQLAEEIRKAGMSVTFFHGKMDKDRKIKNQNLFMNDGADIIVATSAFGMGVDKDDIKTIIHFDISDSLENYIQEAGRAGRKKDIIANCYILFNEDDLNKHFSLLQQTKINFKEVQLIWKVIKEISKYKPEFSNSALEIAQKAGWNTEIRELENKVKASISALEDQGFLERTHNSTQVYASSLLVRNIDKALEIVNATNGLTEKQKEICSRLIQRIIKEDECRIDYLADMLELRISQVQEAITNLRELELLGDSRDLTAFINISRSKNGSRNIIKRFLSIEKELIKILPPNRVKFSIRQLNQKMLDNGIESSSKECIKRILEYWDKRNLVTITRVDRHNELYEIHFRDKSDLEIEVNSRHEMAASCYNGLEKRYAEQSKNFIRKDDLPVQFSLLEMLEEIKIFSSQKDIDIKKCEQALLYLNHIRSIKLEGGFMVIYNKINISNIDNTRVRFTQMDYIKLKNYYEHRIQQIHIIGEYAKKDSRIIRRH